ncbi:MAG: tRNA (adenosine(37)-N6)-threonylcarbamoyltransferase complex ATPase subunit type 1 TsaE [Patescibacteria group bacterium]|jgi:tRNA threonylcarbamoyladenosine biosynthesis protein TsaE
MTYESHSTEQTKKIAADFSKTLHGGEVIALIGDLGSGKTTFVQGIAEALGSTVRVKSPTFAIMHEYPVTHTLIKKIVHLDLYRFKQSVHLEALALEDEKNDHTVIFLEWPNMVDYLPAQPTQTITFTYKTENERTIEMKEISII